MADDPDPADDLRQQADACRRMAHDRQPSGGGAALLSVAHYFEAHARRLDRLRERGW